MVGSRLTDGEIALEPWRVVEGMALTDLPRLRTGLLAKLAG